MPKFIVDLWLDGYETDEEIAKGCEQFIYDQLNMTASSVRITPIPEGGGMTEEQREKEIEGIEELIKKLYKDDDEAWTAGSELDANYLDYLKVLITEVKRLQNELTIKTLENAKGAQVLSNVEAECKRLEKVIELKNRVIDHYLPCPDHRGKLESGRCYLCEVEKLRAFVEKIEGG